MEQPETLSENVQDYVQTRIDLIKLKSIDKASQAITSTVVGVAAVGLGFFILVFLSFAAAFGIGDMVEKTYVGFLAVAGFYALLLLLVYVFREKLITVPVINVALQKYYWKEEERKKEEK